MLLDQFIATLLHSLRSLDRFGERGPPINSAPWPLWALLAFIAVAGTLAYGASLHLLIDLFTYRTPAAGIAPLLPVQFEPVTFAGFAFWNVVVCRIARLRPAWSAWSPAPLGFRYHHVAYRLYARYRPPDPGKPPIEGLYFLRSDCDRRWMTWAGNALTDFRFHTAQIGLRESGSRSVIEVSSPGGNASALVDSGRRPELGWESPFESVEHAAAFLQYKPFGLAAHGRHGANVVAIRRDESRWRARLASVGYAHWEFLDDKPIAPEVCYEVDPIDYQWDRGVIHPGTRRPR